MNDELRAAGDALADELERTTGISDPDVQEMVATYRAARDAAPADEIDRLRARVAELEAAGGDMAARFKKHVGWVPMAWRLVAASPDDAPTTTDTHDPVCPTRDDPPTRGGRHPAAGGSAPASTDGDQ